MCQQEIIKYLLRKRGKEVDINELLRNIPANRTSISRACRVMGDHREIRIRKVKQGPFVRFMFSV